jgi:hypothetical protein
MEISYFVFKKQRCAHEDAFRMLVPTWWLSLFHYSVALAQHKFIKTLFNCESTFFFVKSYLFDSRRFAMLSCGFLRCFGMGHKESNNDTAWEGIGLGSVFSSNENVLAQRPRAFHGDCGLLSIADKPWSEVDQKALSINANGHEARADIGFLPARPQHIKCMDYGRVSKNVRLQHVPEQIESSDTSPSLSLNENMTTGNNDASSDKSNAR